MVAVLDAPPHVVAVRVEGPAAQADANEAAVDAALDAAGPVSGVYVEVGWVWGDAEGEFGDRIRQGFGRLAERPHVRRVAFVAGSYPRRSALRHEAARVDDIEIEVFPTAATAEALAWVSEAGPANAG
ncbi:STAS/SEC14 domain-containing protein [Rubrivirga sp. IMCC43871]|uniref:STAS/SEC14 domain-containing protein n=1 Tax=Rubrivirga sp. IMCC43871 TaxID=3391575 RepID=UPI00398FB3FE